MGEVLQDHRTAGQLGDLVQDLGGVGALHRQLGEDRVQLLRLAQLLQLLVHHADVHGLGDLDEPRLAVEQDDGHPRVARGVQEGGRELGVVLAAELDRDPADPGVGEVVDVAPQGVGVVGHGDTRAEHQLATAQQVGQVGDLGDVDPAHGDVQTVGADHDARAGALEGGQLEDLGESGKHPPILGRTVRSRAMTPYILNHPPAT